MSRLVGFLVGLDTALSSALFVTGSDCTISARCGMALIDAQRGAPVPGIEGWVLTKLGGLLNWISAGHCMRAIQTDRERAVDLMRLTFSYTGPF